MTATYSQSSAQLRGRSVYFQFSNHQSLSDSGDSTSSTGPTSVLLVAISNVLYPISVDVLYQIFCRFGKPQKIVWFEREMKLQALVQMESVEQANAALAGLDGQNIYNNCNTLRVTYSSQVELHCQNGPKSRDFSAPWDPSIVPAQSSVQQPMFHPQFAMHAPHMHHQSAAAAATVSGSAYPSMDPNASAAAAQYHMYPGAASAGPYPPQPMHFGDTPVISVTGIPPDCSIDQLFSLFNSVGDVLRIKIRFHQRDHALIQYTQPAMAQSAVRLLNGVIVNGVGLAVHKSTRVTDINRPSADNDGLTKDFKDSTQHRYRKKAYDPSSAHGPSQVLHVSNLHDTATSADLKAVFGSFFLR